MSRIGKLPIKIPKEVTVNINQDKISIKGPKGELYKVIPTSVNINYEDNILRVTTDSDSEKLSGTYRSLLYNMVTGVVSGFEKKLELQGVGYRSQSDGKNLLLNVGYSHQVKIPCPEGVKLTVENNTLITVSGVNKEVVGQTAANIRLVKPPEPYKGKGIRYQGEYVRKKVGKAGKK